MNHYKEIINKINKLIEDEQKTEALMIVQDELSMPYIPAEIEEILLSYKDELDVKQPTSRRLASEEDIEVGLMSNEPMVVASTIAILETTNIRQHIELVKTFMLSDAENMLKNSLLDVLIKQGIDETITVKYSDGSQSKFAPNKLESFMDPKNIEIYNTILDDQVIGHDISLYTTARQLLEILLLEGYPNPDLNDYYIVCLGLTLKANEMLRTDTSPETIIRLFNMNEADADKSLSLVNSIIK